MMCPFVMAELTRSVLYFRHEARHGEEWNGTDREGGAGLSERWQGKTRQGQVGSDLLRLGSARLGLARRAKDVQGTAWLAMTGRRTARDEKDRTAKARRGRERWGVGRAEMAGDGKEWSWTMSSRMS